MRYRCDSRLSASAFAGLAGGRGGESLLVSDWPRQQVRYRCASRLSAAAIVRQLGGWVGGRGGESTSRLLA